MVTVNGSKPPHLLHTLVRNGLGEEWPEPCIPGILSKTLNVHGAWPIASPNRAEGRLGISSLFPNQDSNGEDEDNNNTDKKSAKAMNKYV